MRKTILIAVGLLLLHSSHQTLRGENKPKVETKTYGIDVSHHQKDIDWSKVRQWGKHDIQFVYIKATEGATYQDPRYAENIKEASENQLNVGSYHYFRTTSSVKAQFENFKKHVDKSKQDLIPLIDVEECKHWDIVTYRKNLREFLSLVEKHYGRKPMIYTVNSFYNKYLANHFSEYYMMIGRYGKNSPWMKDKSTWTIWQFSESGIVDGVTRPVDINVMGKGYSMKHLLLPKKN